MSGRGFISAEDPQRCEFCGTIDETRPYGPNDEEICFDCAMENPEVTKKKMQMYISGDPDA